MACNTTWIGNQLPWSRWEHRGQQPLTQQNDKWYLQLNTSWHCFPCKYVFQLHCFILSIFPLLPIVRPFVSVWINWSQCPQLSKQGETEDDNANTYQEVFTSHLIGPSGSLVRMVLMPFLRQTKAAASCMWSIKARFLPVTRVYFLGYGRAVETDVPLWNRFLKQKNNRGVVRVILFRKKILFKR
jgi:hypothetical protein